MALPSDPIFFKYYSFPGPKTGNPKIEYPTITAPYLTSIESKTPMNNFLFMMLSLWDINFYINLIVH